MINSYQLFLLIFNMIQLFSYFKTAIRNLVIWALPTSRIPNETKSRYVDTSSKWHLKLANINFPERMPTLNWIKTFPTIFSFQFSNAN